LQLELAKDWITHCTVPYTVLALVTGTSLLASQMPFFIIQKFDEIVVGTMLLLHYPIYFTMANFADLKTNPKHCQ
jgi:hypothetical protein